MAAAVTAAPNSGSSMPSIRLIPYITDTYRGLNFPIMERKLANGKKLNVKRFVEKGNVDLSDAIAFKSKVVSRQHGEIWTEGMQFFYRDTKSSSGTFINNIRVCPANTESAPIQLKDGDIIQLGVDYQGRSEDIFRCVRIRVELNREAFKHRNNAFRNQVIRALRALAAASDSDTQGTGDCCICLGAIAPFQALFIAPCCHSFHYKCVRPLLATWPNFACPLCRHFADLSVSTSVDDLALLMIDDGDGTGSPAAHASPTAATTEVVTTDARASSPGPDAAIPTTAGHSPTDPVPRAAPATLAGAEVAAALGAIAAAHGNHDHGDSDDNDGSHGDDDGVASPHTPHNQHANLFLVAGGAPALPLLPHVATIVHADSAGAAAATAASLDTDAVVAVERESGASFDSVQMAAAPAATTGTGEVDALVAALHQVLAADGQETVGVASSSPSSSAAAAHATGEDATSKVPAPETDPSRAGGGAA
ncbi:hypothetical protein BC828DRAFT_401993 [Blastocladiella britannica]|nr:hypothetical protein BC828DRAFT_401993 [Blastocladiella britannica]